MLDRLDDWWDSIWKGGLFIASGRSTRLDFLLNTVVVLGLFMGVVCGFGLIAAYGGDVGKALVIYKPSASGGGPGKVLPFRRKIK